MPLTQQQIERYSRHILLKQVGPAGQEKLLSSKVLIVGAGGLGSPAALYLAAAGVGTLGIIDHDRVELANLQRQIIHHTSDLRKDKAASAKDKVQAINPDVIVKTYRLKVAADNILPIVKEYDFVIDGTDNFAAKFLINDACYFGNVPFSHAGIVQFEGQLMTVLPKRTSCYRCVFDAPPGPAADPTCAQAGVLGVLPGVIGSLQATEAIKYLLGIGQLLTDVLLTYNALSMEFRKVPVKRNPDCRLCGKAPSIVAMKDERQVICDLKDCKC